MSEGSSRLRIYTLITVVYLFWGANFVVSKFALREIPGMLAGGLRTVVGAVLLGITYRFLRDKSRPPVRREELPKLFWIGAAGIGFNQLCFLVGLSLTSASHAAIVIGLTPFMVLALACFRGQERFTPKRAIGLLIAVGGLLLLQKPTPGAQAASLAGDLLILGAGATFAYYTVFGKELTVEHGGMAVIAISYAAASLVLLPVTLYLGWNFDFAAVTTRAWAAFAYMTVVSSVLCYIGWVYALKHLAASRISAFSYLQPLVATLLALPMLGEPVTAAVVGGGTMIMAGVIFSERS